jgi:hypothetical protein
MSTSAPEYPGAAAPERSHSIAADGAELRLHEWGDPEASPCAYSISVRPGIAGFPPLCLCLPKIRSGLPPLRFLGGRELWRRWISSTDLAGESTPA